MKCGKCGEEVSIQPGKRSNFCSYCGNKIEAEKSGDWKYFDNTKELLEYVVAEYGNDALFGRKYFSDHSAPLMPKRHINLVKQAFECGAVKILQDNINADKQHKEIAVKQAVSKMVDTYASAIDAAERVIWEFTNAIGWGMPLSVYPSVGNIIKFALIDWRVLTVENNKALLISEEIVERRPYNVEYKDITWENCTLRNYLNNEFYNKLGAAKSAIAETRNSNPDNPWYGTAGGNATTDKVFLLSLDEVCRYFGDSAANLSKENRKGYIDDKNSSARIANYGNEVALKWWLRSPGEDSFCAANVDRNGRVDVSACFLCNVHLSTFGVRPALWLNL